MGSDQRLPVLDGLRAISILLVLACHMLPLGPKFMQLNYSAGAMGMSLFFALSGFLITSTLLHNPNIHEFAVKRLARYPAPRLPLYVFCLYIRFLRSARRCQVWTIYISVIELYRRRLWHDVLVDGLSCGFHRIERLMRQQGLNARSRLRRMMLDLGERKASAVVSNVLDRTFAAPAPTDDGSPTSPMSGWQSVGSTWPP